MVRMKYFCAVLLAVFALSPRLSAQNQPKTPEEKEKQLLEYVDKEVKRLSDLLELEYWQEFYVDSTLTHDCKAMQAELEDLSKAKVGNTDLYVNVQDKWLEAIDNSYRKYFTDEQWEKYLKTGARKAQKAREKRRAKAEKAARELKSE